MPITPDLSTWKRIESFLEQALDLARDEREAWLVELAKTQPDVAAKVRELLAERDQLDAQGFLLAAPLSAKEFAEGESNPAASMSGAKIGPYTIDRLIGRGGMGEVWLASRSDGRFEGRYAIKFLDPSKTHRTLAERFRQEGRLLGRLTHPNIARLIDAGATDDGKPFLVLEYVDGERLDHYCDTRSLGTEARVKLFLAVVAAVAHAHSQLIVHRDLKPSNVLVTKEGVVKLLDFGIAKLLGVESEQEDTHTRVEEMVFTPEYAAPEQLLGDPPSTATDVYQLGMLLYVLLTGSHPIEATGSRSERIKAALNGRIPRASQFAQGELREKLRGDLDAILEKAMHAEAAGRYPTAAALEDELRRYLNREPVVARRGAAFYRTRKFIARHRVAVTASLVAVVGLVVTSVVALEQAHRARVQRDRAVAFASRSRAITEFLRQVITEAGDSSTPVTVGQMIARTEKLVLDGGRGSAENRAAIMSMLASYYHTWGDQEKAVQMDERGLALLSHSVDQELQSQIACSHALMVGNTGRPKEGIALIKAELGKLKSDPATMAECLRNLADLALDTGEPAESLRYALQALDRFHEAGEDDPFNEGTAYGAVGLAYHDLGQNADANKYFGLAMKKYVEAGRGGSMEAIVQRSNWALVVSGAGQPREALRLYGEITEAISQRDPTSHLPSALVHNRARALQLLGRFDEARAEFQRAAQYATEEKNKNTLGLSLLGLASVADEVKNETEAVDYLRQSIASQDRPLPPTGLLATGHLLMQGKIDLAAGRFDDARKQLTRVLDMKKKNLGTIDAALTKSETELRSGNVAAAEADARLALDISTSLQGGVLYSNRTGLAWLMLGRTLKQAGKDREARSAFDSAVVQLSNTVDEGHPALVRARELAAQTADKTAAVIAVLASEMEKRATA